MNKNGHKEEKIDTKKENAKDDSPCILLFIWVTALAC